MIDFMWPDSVSAPRPWAMERCSEPQWPPKIDSKKPS